MARYSVQWDASKAALIINKADALETKAKKNIGEVFLPVAGEIPDASPHPEPGAHLRNLAFKQGYKDYNLVTVINHTDHEGFDAYAKEVDPDYLAQHEATEEGKLTVGSSPINDEKSTLEPGEGEDNRTVEEKSGSTRVSTDSEDGAKEGPNA